MTTPPVFYIVQKTVLPALTVRLLDGNGDAVQIPSAATVKFTMQPVGGGALVVNGAACAVLDDGSVGLRGQVRYSWQAADTNVAGTYRGQFKVTFGDGTTEMFPIRDYVVIVIEPDLE